MNVITRKIGISRQVISSSISLWLVIVATGYSTAVRPEQTDLDARFYGDEREVRYEIERSYLARESFRPIAVSGELTLLVDGRTPTILLVDEHGDEVAVLDTNPLIPHVAVSVERKVYLFGEPIDRSNIGIAIFDPNQSDALRYLRAYFRVSSGVYDKNTDSLVLADRDSEALIILNLAGPENQYAGRDHFEVEPRRLYLKGGPPAHLAHDEVNSNLYVSHFFEPAISTVSLVQKRVIDYQRTPFNNPVAGVALTVSLSELERVHLLAYDKYETSILLFDIAQCRRSLCVSDSIPAAVNTPFFGGQDKDPRSSSVHIFSIRPGELIVAQEGSDRLQIYKIDWSEFVEEGLIEMIQSLHLPRKVEYFLEHPDKPCIFLTTNQGQVFEVCGEPVIPAAWPNGYFGYTDTRTPIDRDEELAQFAGKDELKLVRVPGSGTNKLFTDLCREVGKACRKVLDWDNFRQECSDSADDGSRMALCMSNLKNGYYAWSETNTKQDREKELFDLSSNYFVRLNGSSGGSFSSVCQSIGKHCWHVMEWQGDKEYCSINADDGSQMALCNDDPKPPDPVDEVMQ